MINKIDWAKQAFQRAFKRATWDTWGEIARKYWTTVRTYTEKLPRVCFQARSAVGFSTFDREGILFCQKGLVEEAGASTVNKPARKRNT